MIERRVNGQVPKKHHLKLSSPDGKLYWEQCHTREGFEAAYTISYHQHAPHRQEVQKTEHGWPARVAAPPVGLKKRHFLSQKLDAAQKCQLDARVPLLFNDDVTLGVVKPSVDDPVYFANGDGDDLFFVHQGGGTLRSVYGDVEFGEGDYLFVPRGVLHRFLLKKGAPQHWLWLEARGGLFLPKQWRNEVGQLRMDAPFCHRDFRGAVFSGPLDEGLRTQVVKRGDVFHGFTTKENALDVVGWDGSVYPWAFHILDFQPRVGLTHLPPTWHGTFALRGGLVCSFVPRPVDFHPDAIPCPYPHSSVDVDEFIFYVRGNFTSRKGVGPGSMSFHPAGLPHGPHPGAYEASIGTKETNELAVMLDVAKPLQATTAALTIEDEGYHQSFVP